MSPATKQRREERTAARAWLAERFPKAFAAMNDPRKTALKVGIGEDLFRAIEGADHPPKRALQDAIKDYVKGPRYLLACAEGSQRIDLDGEFAGFVSSSEAGHALHEMKRIVAGMEEARSRPEGHHRLLAELKRCIASRGLFAVKEDAA